MNSVSLVGRLVADPEIKYSNGGSTIGRFRIAVDRRIKTENGPDADFISCVAFGKTAEFLEKYFHKGMRIGLTGRIQTGSYEKDGQTIYTTDVIAENVEFVESKNNQGGQQGGQQSAPAQNAAHAGAGDGFMNLPDGIDEDLPFN